MGPVLPGWRGGIIPNRIGNSSLVSGRAVADGLYTQRTVPVTATGKHASTHTLQLHRQHAHGQQQQEVEPGEKLIHCIRCGFFFFPFLFIVFALPSLKVHYIDIQLETPITSPLAHSLLVSFWHQSHNGTDMIVVIVLCVVLAHTSVSAQGL